MQGKIEISHKTILFTFAVLGAIWFLAEISDILLLLLIAFIIQSALKPLVERMEKWRLPRPLTILLVYIIAVGVVGGAIGSLIPAIVSQTGNLTHVFITIATRVFPNLNIDPATIAQQVAPVGENILKFTVGIFSNVISMVTVMVFGFYMILESKNIDNMILSMFGKTMGGKTISVVRAIESRLGAWVQSELTLMLTIGILTYIGLSILHVEFALPLAVIAGLLEIVPTIGPIVSAVPAILVAISISPLFALTVAALYFVIQQLENHVIVPLVMRQQIGLSPLITIFALMVGGKLAGVTGAILSVPVVLILQEVIQSLVRTSEE